MYVLLKVRLTAIQRHPKDVHVILHSPFFSDASTASSSFSMRKSESLSSTPVADLSWGWLNFLNVQVKNMRKALKDVKKRVKVRAREA
jgi:hypothetical protein